MKDRKTVFIYSPEAESLAYPPDCPFKTERAGLTRQRLRSFGLLGVGNHTERRAQAAGRADLERFHRAGYLDELERAAAGDLTLEGLAMGLGGPDTPVFADMLAYSSWACGAALTAADTLAAGEADVAFNLYGGFHHAMPAKAAGFCYLNDQVLACERLAARGRRVAYLDVDAHHGDGVQHAFYARNDVLTVSLHESGRTLFPWGGYESEIGEGAGRGFNVNVSLPAGAYDEAFLLALDRVAWPVLHAYGPDIMVVELGLDTLAGDPLTHLHLTNNVVVELVERLLEFECPLLIAGGGGYHVEHTVRGLALAWRTVCREGDEEVYRLGLGGVMLGSSEWAGGLRDRALAVTAERRESVMPELCRNLASVTEAVFPIHELSTKPGARGEACGARPLPDGGQAPDQS